MEQVLALAILAFMSLAWVRSTTRAARVLARPAQRISLGGGDDRRQHARGAVQVIDKPDLLWLRKAFDSEWKGASMLQLAEERIYSIESVNELSEKLRNAKVVLAEFSAPDANRLRLVVSVKRVRQVIQSNPVIFHEKARSVLVFPGKLRLAVRETPEEARQKLIS